MLIAHYRLGVQRVLASTAREQFGFWRLLLTAAACESIGEFALCTTDEV